MKLRVLSKWSILVFSLGLIIFCLINISFNFNIFTKTSSAEETLSTVAATKNRPKESIPGIPARLSIPKFKINALLEQVGLTSLGAVGVPVSLRKAAWFNLGPRPGDKGTAVIVGHYGYWKNGATGVFNNLSKLRPGDLIYVEDKAGKTIVFIVRKLHSYSSGDDFSEVFDSGDNQARLNLITCEGVWDKVSKTYSQRLVIFAEKK